MNPFQAHSCESIDIGVDQFNECEWVIDFGPWKKGEHSECVCVDYTLSQIKEYDRDSGKIVKYCGFNLVPRELTAKEIEDMEIPF